ncbi:neurofilament heavy polypeptide-like [Argiope bruennichi]|nr:neurofilament heavy polypeptide-like [Argiope bruennichi]
MAGSKNMNYKICLETFMKIYFPSEKVDNSGKELLSNLLNDANSMLISQIEKDFSSVSKVNGQTFQHCARKAIDAIFPQELKAHALSEAYKQLVLLESGCILYKEADLETDDNAEVPRRSTRKDRESKIDEGPVRLFKSGITKMCPRVIPNVKVDSKAMGSLAYFIHSFNKIVAERASEKFGKKEELQPADLRQVLNEYLKDNVQKSAISEGNKSLALYESGLLEFKPRPVKVKKLSPKPKRESPKRLPKKRRSKSPQKVKLRIKKPIKSPIKSKRPSKVRKVSPKPKRKSPKRLPEAKKRKASSSPKRPSAPKKRRSKTPPKEKLRTRKPFKKVTEIKKPAKSPIKPKRPAKVKKLTAKRKHKSPKRLSDVKKRKASTSPKPSPKKRKVTRTPKRPSTPKKQISKTPARKKQRTKKPSKKVAKIKRPVKVPIKLKKLAKIKKLIHKRKRSVPKRPPAHKKRKVSKRPKRPSTPKKRRSTSPPKEKPRTKKPSKKILKSQSFAAAMSSCVLKAFSDIDISLAKDTASKFNQILEETCDALIKHSISHAAKSNELSTQDIEAALLKLFPPELAAHALSVATNAVSLYFEEMKRNRP